MQPSKLCVVSNSVVRAIVVVMLGVAITAALLLVPVCEAREQLIYNFYKKSCPSAESIVQQVVKKYIGADPTLAASILRLHYHDCFVRVCQLFQCVHTLLCVSKIWISDLIL
jgi:hypothetical protein